jgi:hypothetical protein
MREKATRESQGKKKNMEQKGNCHTSPARIIPWRFHTLLTQGA